MQVKLLRENEDGSADYAFDMTKEEEQALICHAIVKALEELVKNGEKYVASEVGLGDTGCGGEDCLHGSCEQPCKSGQPGDCSQAAGLSD